MKFSYHFLFPIAAVASSTFLFLGNVSAAEQNLRATASFGNMELKEENLNYTPGSILNNFIDSATLVGDDITNYKIQIIDDKNKFTIEGEQLDVTQFHQVNVRNDQALSASRILQASVSDGEAIVRMNQSGNIEQVTKINTTTGVRFHLERLDGDIFIEYSSNDIDQDRLNEFILDVVTPPLKRHLTEEKNERNYQPKLNNHRQKDVCDNPTAIRVAVRYSSSLCQDLGNDRINTEAYLEQIFSIINVSFQVAGLCQELEICNMEGACNDGMNSQFDDIANLKNICDGYPLPNVLDSFISEVIDEDFVGSDECDIAHFVFGSKRRIDDKEEKMVSGVVGCANSFSLCDAAAGSVSKIQFTNSIDLRATLIAQEIGFNLGGYQGGAMLGAFVSAGSENQIEKFVEYHGISPTCTASGSR